MNTKTLQFVLAVTISASSFLWTSCSSVVRTSSQRNIASMTEHHRLSDFDGGYIQISGEESCPNSLQLSAHYSPQGIDRMETDIPNYDFAFQGEKQIKSSSSSACSSFVQDELIESNEQKLEIIRSFSQRCAGIKTFAGFHVWQFLARPSGLHEVSFQRLQGKHAKCGYRKLASSLKKQPS